MDLSERFECEGVTVENVVHDQVTWLLIPPFGMCGSRFGMLCGFSGWSCYGCRIGRSRYSSGLTDRGIILTGSSKRMTVQAQKDRHDQCQNS